MQQERVNATVPAALLIACPCDSAYGTSHPMFWPSVFVEPRILMQEPRKRRLLPPPLMAVKTRSPAALGPRPPSCPPPAWLYGPRPPTTPPPAQPENFAPPSPGTANSFASGLPAPRTPPKSSSGSAFWPEAPVLLLALPLPAPPPVAREKHRGGVKRRENWAKMCVAKAKGCHWKDVE